MFGVLYVFIAYVGSFFEPVMQLANILARFQQAQASAERLLDLIEKEAEIFDTPEVIEKYGTAIDFKKENWEEFLDLCVAAWPGFESSYNSRVIGLWRIENDTPEMVKSLLLTRRPDLAMWERSKIPQGELEAEVRRKLSRRYDLCTSTVVYTTTLLTASDHEDTARWT